MRRMPAGDPEEWSKMIKLNVEAPMRFARAISPSMVHPSYIGHLE